MTTVQRLDELRNGLLTLHKALLDSEQADYEHTIKKLTSRMELLGLLISDPKFAWLRQLSAMIASIDERMDEDAPVTDLDADRIIRAARDLLRPTDEGEGFGRQYYEAMQRDPEVIIAHGVATKLLARLLPRG